MEVFGSNRKIISVIKFMFSRFSPKSKKILLGLCVLSLISLVYLYLQISSPTPPPPPPVIIQPNTTQYPTPDPKLVQIYPPDAQPKLAFPEMALAFTFDQEINLTSIRVFVSPFQPVNAQVSQDKRTLYVAPKPSWTYNTEYVISVYGVFQEPIYHRFQPLPVPEGSSGGIEEQTEKVQKL